MHVPRSQLSTKHELAPLPTITALVVLALAEVVSYHSLLFASLA
jgi:hypothetical protein